MADAPARELDAALDALIERFGGGAYVDEIARARTEYAERTGKVYEDDEIFEARTVSFLEWYVLERPLAAAGVPPVELALAGGGGDADARAAWSAWATSHRSLFLVRSLRDGDVRLVDLFGGARFAVDERRRLHGVAPGDVIEARLVGWRDKVRFGRTFCFHPAAARKAIAAQVARIRAAGGARADAVDLIATLRVRCLRYQHVEPARVYQDFRR